jgi:hypothetical protein
VSVPSSLSSSMLESLRFGKRYFHPLSLAGSARLSELALPHGGGEARTWDVNFWEFKPHISSKRILREKQGRRGQNKSRESKVNKNQRSCPKKRQKSQGTKKSSAKSMPTSLGELSIFGALSIFVVQLHFHLLTTL